MNITVRHLQQVEAIARQGTFAGAARELNISQPALSRSVALLEEQLGVKLFDRSKREVVATVFGRHILERGKPVLNDMQIMERDLHLLQGLEAGELVIGSGPVPAETSLGKAVAKLCRNYPGIDVQIIVNRTPTLLAGLYARELDLFVADTRMLNDTSRLNVTLLPRQKGYFCCRKGHPLTGKKRPRITDIMAYPMAVMWFPDLLLRSLSQAAGLHLESISNLPNAVLQCDYLKVLFDIVADSDAVGLITRPILERSVHQSELVLLPLTIPGLHTHYGMVSLARYSRSAIAEKFEQYLLATEDEFISDPDCEER